MYKLASKVTVGDVIEIWEEGRREEDDICYLYEVTAVKEVTAGPLFNPQRAIEVTVIEVETGHPMALPFTYHPDHEVMVQNFPATAGDTK